jgi:MFS transporter, DHA2 family, multidrug resistance protein
MPGEAQNLRSGVAAAQEAGVVVDKWTRWMIAVAAMMSAVMELVDTSAVNVSLPYIAGNLSATVNEATWVLTSYLIANAIILPVSGWLTTDHSWRWVFFINIPVSIVGLFFV